MDFFKSVFSPDLDPDHDQTSDNTASASSNPNPNPNRHPPGGGWNLSGLIKNVASKSESVIQTYRRDLEEFGLGLKKETAVIREVAAKSVDEIIKHGKEVLAVDSHDDSSNNAAGKKYTRIEAQIMAIQSDEGTFITDPEDVKDFENWKIGFDLEEKKEEIEMLLYDSDVMESMSEKFIPDIVDYWTFWYRYFYRVCKAKQAEEARAELVKRVISRDEEEEEELSWEVDDDEELDRIEVTREDKEPKDGDKKQETHEIRSVETQVGKERDDKKNRELHEIEKIEGTQVEKVQTEGEVKKGLNEPETNEDNPVEKVEKDEKTDMETVATAETQESRNLAELESKQGEEAKNASVEKDTASVTEPVPTGRADVSDSAISKDEKLNLKSEAEEDLEWDEIEDLGEGDNNKPSGSNANPDPKIKEDLRKRLSVAEDDDDLTWDIEEDDDDVPTTK